MPLLAENVRHELLDRQFVGLHVVKDDAHSELAQAYIWPAVIATLRNMDLYPPWIPIKRHPPPFLQTVTLGLVALVCGSVRFEMSWWIRPVRRYGGQSLLGLQSCRADLKWSTYWCLEGNFRE